MSRVLVIEDSEFTRHLLVRTLQANGYEVFEACNGYEGVLKAKKEMPDCILLDLLMPEMDGFDVLEALKKKSLDIPVVILSADVQETSRKKCFDYGVVDFVRKPPKEADLTAAIRKALNSKVGAKS